jgi:hypothetical protein
MEINMTISTGISNTLNTDLVALSNQVQSSDTTIKGDQRVAELAAKVLKDIDQESSLLSPMSKKYIDDVKSIIEAKEWNKLPVSTQLNSDIELFNKLAKDISFASEFVGVDINDVLSMLLEFERKNSSIQSQMRMESREGMFNAALAEFAAKARANAAEKEVGITSAALGAASAATTVIGGFAGGRSAVDAVGSAKQGMQFSKQKSFANERNETARIENKEIFQEMKNIKQKIDNEKDQKIKNIAEKKLEDLKFNYEKNKEEIITTQKDLDYFSHKLETNNQITSSQNQIAVNASAVIGGLGKVVESSGQIGVAFLRYEQKTEELNADKYALSKNIASESNQAANDAYQQARDQFNNIMESLKSITQVLDSSMSKQVSMA